MTSSDDRKCCHGDAEAGPLWSMLRLMLDVSLLGRVSFVVLAVSILLCYLGQSFVYVKCISEMEPGLNFRPVTLPDPVTRPGQSLSVV